MKGQASRTGAGDDAGERGMGRGVCNDFQALVQTIARIHGELAKKATPAVNSGLKLRNWMIGVHIAEYELNREVKKLISQKRRDEIWVAEV